MNTQSVGRCPTCGKMRYASKRQAKAAGRLAHPGHHLNEYRCGDYWHIGHLPASVRRGEYDRSIYDRGRA